MSGIVFGIEVTKTGLVKKNVAHGAYQRGNEFQLCHLLAVTLDKLLSLSETQFPHL